MTDTQWLFHYHMIMSRKQEEDSEKVDIIKALVKRFTDTLIDAAELNALIVNPQSYSVFSENKQKAKGEDTETKRLTLEEEFKKFMENDTDFPTVLVAKEVKKDERPSGLKKVTGRSLGITKHKRGE